LQRKENPRWFFATKFHKTTKGKPLDFVSSPFLEPIYRDNCQEMVIMKAMQVFITEFLLCDSLALADNGLSIFYVLPTESLRNIMVHERLDRLLLSVPYYKSQCSKELKKIEGIPETDSVGLKAFGSKGMMLFVGSNSKVPFLYFPADCIVIDEYDRCDQENIAMAPDRLMASDYKLKRFASAPTVEGFGIDEKYEQSDQRRWLVKCEHCGKWMGVDFFKSVVREVSDRRYVLIDQEWTEKAGRDIYTICPSCHKPFNRLAKGEWVASYPQRLVHGYGSISQMISHKSMVKEIYDEFVKALANEYKKQRFYNSVLGQAYTSTGAKLSRALLDGCIKAGQSYNMPSMAEHTTMGVDVGNVMHVLISDHPESKRRPVFIGTVQSFDDLHALVSRYGVDMACIDYEPERREALRFQEKAQCEVWVCDYSPHPQNTEEKIDYDKRFIVADRTQVADAFVGDITTQVLLLPANAPTLEDGEFFNQLCAPTRVMDEDTGLYRWTAGSKPDHFFHAGIYERIASRFFSEPRVAPLYEEKRDPCPHRNIIRVRR
jgi:hypothetical protein